MKDPLGPHLFPKATVWAKAQRGHGAERVVVSNQLMDRQGSLVNHRPFVGEIFEGGQNPRFGAKQFVLALDASSF